MPHQCTDCGTTFADGSTEMLSGCPDCGGNTFQFLPDSGASGAESTPPADAGSEPTAGPEPPAEPGPDVDRPSRPSPSDSVAKTVGNAAKTVREFVGGDSDGPGTSPEAADPLAPWPDENSSSTEEDTQRERTSSGVSRSSSLDRDRPAPTSGGEDVAQASARSAVVAPEELPESGTAEMAAGAPSASSPPPQTESTVEGPEPDRRGDGSDRPDLEELREELNDQFESIRIVEPGQYELNLMELYEREEYIIALQEDGRYRIQVPESW